MREKEQVFDDDNAAIAWLFSGNTGFPYHSISRIPNGGPTGDDAMRAVGQPSAKKSRQVRPEYFRADLRCDWIRG
jgi:hypothetical protein